jgi:hypothetical protein
MLLNIPVKPHVLKFLEEKYQQKYVLNEYDYVGTIIYTLIRRQSNWSHYSKFMSQYTQQFPVEVPEKLYFQESCRHLTPFTISKFNSIIEGIMRDQCIYHCYLVLEEKNLKNEIYKWLELYDIEEGGSFNYRSLSEHFYRFMKQKKNQKTCLNNVSQKTL